MPHVYWSRVSRFAEFAGRDFSPGTIGVPSLFGKYSGQKEMDEK
jgi:hypothetical protein